MLNTETKKRDSEKLVFPREIPMKIASANPFESSEDVILLGDLKSIDKKEIKLNSRDEINIIQEKIELECLNKENQINNALKDVKNFPKNPFILNNLGLAYLGSKETEKAFKIFKKVVELKPDYIPAILNLASLYTAKKEYDIALKTYENLIANNPDDTRVLLNMANIYFKKTQFKQARELYEKVIRLDSENISSLNHLALLNLIDHKFEKAISVLRKCLKINNNLPSIYNNLGVAYSVIGAYKKAIKSFRIALNIFPYYTSAIYNLSITLAKEDILASIDTLEDYLDKRENPKIRELLARCYLENRQFKKALKNISDVLESAKKINNNDKEIVRLHNNVGVAYSAIGNYTKAEEHYKACMRKMDFVNEIILSNIIDLYFENHNKAIKDYIEIFLDKFGKTNLYYYYLGKYNLIIGNTKESIIALRKCLKIKKEFAPAYTLLGYIYSEYIQNYREALSLNEEGYKYFPNEKSIINNLAYNYLMIDEIDKAEEILRKVEDVNNNIFINATRGLLNIKRGNITEGRRLYNLAARLAGKKELSSLVEQKKCLELAKFYLKGGENKKAKSEINKIISIGKDTVYTEQAKELNKQIV